MRNMRAAQPLIPGSVPTAAEAAQNPVEVGSITDPMTLATLGISFDETVAVQVVNPLRAAAVTVINRFTRQTGFTIRAAKLHESLGAALTHILTHSAKIPGVVNMKVQWGDQTYWLAGCGVISRRLVSPDAELGLTTVFEYAIVGGLWTLNQNA